MSGEGDRQQDIDSVNPGYVILKQSTLMPLKIRNELCCIGCLHQCEEEKQHCGHYSKREARKLGAETPINEGIIDAVLILAEAFILLALHTLKRRKRSSAYLLNRNKQPP